MEDPTDLSQENRKLLIAVIGDASIPPDHEKYELAMGCGKLLVDHGYRVVTGGLGGVMEAASKGARSSPSYTGGDTVAILPGLDPGHANEFSDVVIPTGMDVARNLIVANSVAVIALGGGAGTLSEMAIAWQLKRLIIALRVDGWSGRLADTRIDSRVRDKDIDNDQIYGVDTAEEAVRVLAKLLPQYQRRHRGIRRRN